MNETVLEILKTIPNTFSLNNELINTMNSGIVKINNVYNQEYELKLNRENIILYYFECAENFTKIINSKTEYQVIFFNLFGNELENIYYKSNRFYDKNDTEIYDIIQYIKKFPILQISIENDNILKKYSIYTFSNGDNIYYLNNENNDVPIMDEKQIIQIKINKDKFSGNTVLYELFNLLWFYILCGFLTYKINFDTIILKLEDVLHDIFKDNINIFLLNFCFSIVKILVENDLKYYYIFTRYYYIYFNKYLDPSKEDEVNNFLYNYKNDNKIPYNNVYKQIVNIQSKVYFYDFLKEFVKNISNEKYIQYEKEIIKSCELYQNELQKNIQDEERNINNNLFQLLDIQNWISFENNVKFLFRSYEYNDPRLREYSQDISNLMNECFNLQKYNVELNSKWLLMFDEEKKAEKKLIGFMTIDNLNTIWNVCVKKEYRDKGIAAKLMEQTIKFACKKGGNPPTLLVDKQGVKYNKLIELYGNFGFEIWDVQDINIVNNIFRGMGPDRYTYMIYNCKNPFGHPFMKINEKNIDYDPQDNNYENWFASKKYFKNTFLIRSYSGKDNKVKKYSHYIYNLLTECFGQGNYEIEEKSNWVLVFAVEKQQIKDLAAIIMIDDLNVIWNVCVKKEYRRHGIAQELVSRAINYICQYSQKKIYPRLTVDKNSPNYSNLMKMYKSFGFEELFNISPENIKLLYRGFLANNVSYMIYKCQNFQEL